MTEISENSDGFSSAAEGVSTFGPLCGAVYLTGPTASGKTAVGIELARRLDAEILSLDSMAVYRRMNIGTAKPTETERGAAAHHLIDLVEPWEEFSLAAYLDAAHKAADAVRRRGKRILVVGGTPLYLKGLLRGIFEGPPADEAFRGRMAELERAKPGALHRRLAASDPTTAERLHPNDVKRLIRALEVLERTGKPISSFQTQFSAPSNAAASPVFVLDWPRPTLYDRINRRVDAMMADGLLDEVRALGRMERPISKTAAAGVGYRELFDYLDGQTTLDEAVERIKRSTRNFAKRQMTWFRSFDEARFLPMDGTADAAETILQSLSE